MAKRRFLRQIEMFVQQQESRHPFKVAEIQRLPQ